MTALAPSPRTRRRRLSPLALFEALATPHGVDRYLELVHPMLTVRELRAEVTEVRPATDDTRHPDAAPHPPVARLPGRPVRRRSPSTSTACADTRCYSPSSSQYRADGRFELTVKAHPGGLVSQHLGAHAKPGLVVGLSQADGTFTLPEPRPERILLISGGSGITPVLSMLRTLCDEGHLRGRDRAPALLRPRRARRRIGAELRALAAARTRTSPSLSRLPGRAMATSPGGSPPDAPACGRALVGRRRGNRDVPVRSGVAHGRGARPLPLAAAGEQRLHTEEFRPPPAVAPEAAATGTVTFSRSAPRRPTPAQTLLDQAEAAGLTPEHGCRMGICFSCTQVKTRGCTRNIRTGETQQRPRRRDAAVHLGPRRRRRHSTSRRPEPMTHHPDRRADRRPRPRARRAAAAGRRRPRRGRPRLHLHGSSSPARPRGGRPRHAVR